VQVLIVLPLDVGEQPVCEAPLPEQVVGGRRLDRLVGHHADGLGEAEVPVDDLAANPRATEARLQQAQGDGGSLDLREWH
jgi:hypothetical protein